MTSGFKMATLFVSRHFGKVESITTLIWSHHETFNRLTADQCINNVRDVPDRDAPVKKVIGFD